MELLVKLGINWQLLAAQVVNFLIVLGVLGFFVYKPFLNLLDSRAERIRKAMEDAKRIENQMKEFEAVRQEELKKIDAESGAYFERVRKQAEALQEEILENARKEAQAVLDQALRRIDEERRAMMDEAMKTLSKVIVSMTEKILEREFSPADQERIVKSLSAELPKTLR